MTNDFITWEMLLNFSSLVSIVYILTQFTKELKFIKNINTKYYSAFIAFILIVLSNLKINALEWFDLILYVLSAILVSMAANGLHDFNLPTAKNFQKE